MTMSKEMSKLGDSDLGLALVIGMLGGAWSVRDGVVGEVIHEGGDIAPALRTYSADQPDQDDQESTTLVPKMFLFVTAVKGVIESVSKTKNLLPQPLCDTIRNCAPRQ